MIAEKPACPARLASGRFTAPRSTRSPRRRLAFGAWRDTLTSWPGFTQPVACFLSKVYTCLPRLAGSPWFETLQGQGLPAQTKRARKPRPYTLYLWSLVPGFTLLHFQPKVHKSTLPSSSHEPSFLAKRETRGLTPWFARGFSVWRIPSFPS